jgi:hypothetical protein
MNWMTTQLAGLHYFGDLASDSLDTPEPGLHVVRYTSVRDTLRSLDVTIDSEVSLDPYFLFVEDAESAATRAERATPAGRGGPQPSIFTLALDDGKGTVLYLPEDDSPTQDLQLFSLVDQRISRINASGGLGATYAQLDTVNAQPLIHCSDGPCQAWGEACGDGCECNLYEVSEAFSSALPAHFTAGPGHTYTLVCE